MEHQTANLKEPVFFVGAPRSGTTIISEIISSHSTFGWFSNYYNRFPFLPELSFLNRILDIPKFGWYLRGNKKQGKRPYSDIRRLLPYSVEAYGVWERHCGSKFLYNYLIGEVATRYEAETLRKAVKKSLAFQGKHRLISKITGPSRIGYIRSIFPDAMFIHVIRDPRAVVSSLMRVNFWKENGGLKNPWWKDNNESELLDDLAIYSNKPVALAAIQWKKIILTTWKETKSLNTSDYLQIKYEDFVCNPRSTIENILDLIGLPFDKMIDKYFNTLVNISDNSFKFNRFLKTSDIDLITEITEDVALKAGYEL